MRLAVLGLWHLGSVVAACMARAGHDVVGWDVDHSAVTGLQQGRAPIAEPGLDDLLSEGIAARRLRFTSTVAEAVADADVVWIAFDTPVDDEDRADDELVLGHARGALPHVKAGALVISSSQLPVGSVARLEREAATRASGRRITFACLPENLRLGRALDVFLNPDRVVAGVRNDHDRQRLTTLLAPITDRIVWMSVESAEMTKHSINAFLATSVAFINEIAAVCETVGADAKEVEAGLKSDRRIGPTAYLAPGGAFAGGTLARDLVLLERKAADGGLQTPLIHGVYASNREHASWMHRTLTALFDPLTGRRVAVWGLTYKPGTDTLRRSLSVELCQRLARDGATVTAFDPSIRTMPPILDGVVTLTPDPLAAASRADAIVVATEWPVLRTISADALLQAVPHPLVIDAGRFLAQTIGGDSRVRYIAVGTPRS
jgi:UDPglucose 6-dehydrogenase